MPSCPACGRRLVDGRCAACGTAREGLPSAVESAPYPPPSSVEYPYAKDGPVRAYPASPPARRGEIRSTAGVFMGFAGIFAGLLMTGIGGFIGFVLGLAAVNLGVRAWIDGERWSLPAVILGIISIFLPIGFMILNIVIRL